MSFRVYKGLGTTQQNENRRCCHPRVSGGPRQSIGRWIPAFVGMTGMGRFSTQRSEEFRSAVRWIGALAGCGKTLHGCHPERSEGSRSAYLLENAQGQILRFALHRTVRGFAQNDSFEEFFRGLLGGPGDWVEEKTRARFLASLGMTMEG